MNKNSFTAILINARSIKNKMASLNKMLNELTADLCLLTETWLKDEEGINDMIEDFTNTSPYGLLRKDRVAGKRGGGIAICYNREKIQLTKAKIPPSKHECAVPIHGHIDAACTEHLWVRYISHATSLMRTHCT